MIKDAYKISTVSMILNREILHDFLLKLLCFLGFAIMKTKKKKHKEWKRGIKFPLVNESIMILIKNLGEYIGELKLINLFS